MKALFLATIIMISLINTASATYNGCSYNYLVSVNHSDFAYGKTVRSVNIHSGTLESTIDSSRNTETHFWNDVKDQGMEKVGNHFFAKTTTSGYKGGGSGQLSTKNLGLVIQYWVTFEDGSTLISPVYAVKIVKSFGPHETSAIFEAQENFVNQNDSDSTFALETYFGIGCGQ